MALFHFKILYPLFLVRRENSLPCEGYIPNTEKQQRQRFRYAVSLLLAA